MSENKKLIELLPEQFTGDGVFTRMKQVVGEMPWEKSVYSALFSGMTNEDLDFLYGVRSSEKSVPYIIQGDNTLNVFLRGIARKYIYAWDQMAKTFLLEYNPIENYNMVESSTGKDNGTTTSTQTHDMAYENVSNSTQTNDLTTNITTANIKTHDLTVNDTNNGTETKTANLDVKGNDTKTTSGGYTDAISQDSTTTNTDSGNDVITHNDMTSYTDTVKHDSDNYLKTNERLVAAFDSSTTEPDAKGTTNISGNTGTITITDNSGYQRESKTIEGENGVYTDTTTHVSADGSKTVDDTKFGKTTTVNVVADGAKNNTSRTYSELKDVVDHASTEKNTGTTESSVTTNETTTGTIKDDGENKQTETGTISNSGNNTQKTTGTIGNSNESTAEHTTNLTRSGNIGVTSSQQLLLSEISIIDIRSKYFEKVFDDVDSMLTLAIWL